MVIVEFAKSSKKGISDTGFQKSRPEKPDHDPKIRTNRWLTDCRPILLNNDQF